MASMFTEERRRRVLEILRAGGSRTKAAHAAGLHHTTVVGWIRRGKRAPEGTRYASFYQDVLQAEASHELVVLESRQRAMQSDPMVAWAFLAELDERTIESYVSPQVPASGVIQLHLGPLPPELEPS